MLSGLDLINLLYGLQRRETGKILIATEIERDRRRWLRGAKIHRERPAEPVNGARRVADRMSAAGGQAEE